MRIGEFAQLGQVSVRMLRHYESMDLLAPDSVDPFTGHRSYTVAQLPRLNRIMALIEGTDMNHPDCIIKELPAERVLGQTVVLGEPPFDTSEIGPLFGSVADRLAEAGIRHAAGVGIYSDAGHGTEVTCGYRTESAQEIESLQVTELKSCTAATLIHEGSMSRIGASWQHLSEWCISQGYSLTGPCREVYLETGDDNTADNSDQAGWIVELQQPIIV
ncbi:GyrI-like domain-containing protein [Brevibacterium sp. 'Marine']|uniref:MerR family transcriptional regulator n=1 Tax=Brevibacterium sp. 'Marine' TaxID=2725563 RepID=UPI00145EF41B|nr:GyrI-like domain-containing protein [Brevibacterium sp. 'Marine']